jgi:cytochrome c-type biogenesis protein CcmH/NrfG
MEPDMKRDALVFVVSGTFFGLIVGWILGSQAPRSSTPPPTTIGASAQPSPPGADTTTAPPPLDIARAAELEQLADAQPTDAGVRVDLGNLYMDAERFDLAIPWYEAALALRPEDVNVSTDLAVCYYYTNQPDRALAQLDRSLALDEDHVKTIFNQGIIRAGGMGDLAGATESFMRVVTLAPGSPEGQEARRLLETIADHAGRGVGAGSAGGGP